MSAVQPVPAVFVSTTDPRLFPTEEMLEAARVEAREKQLPPSRPILFTTIGDEPSENLGCKGKCDAKDCDCLYFAGKDGDCTRCKHPNLYHRVKIRRVDLEAKASADALKKEKHRRHIPTQKEIEEQKSSEENKPPEPVNIYPCDCGDCECKKMIQPVNWDATSVLPKLCRNCKHAEMYHVKRKKEDKTRRTTGKSKSTKGAAGSSSSAASARNTQRGSTSRGGIGSASPKKGSSASGKKSGKK